jgi:hypothetical protein
VFEGLYNYCGGLGQEVYSLKVPKLPARPSRKGVLEARLVSHDAEGSGSELLVVCR